MSKNDNIEINEAVLFAYFGGDLPDNEILLVESWRDVNAENLDYFDEIKAVWEVTGKIIVKPVAVDEEKAWSKVSDKIETAKEIQMKPNNSRIWMGIAASVIVILGLTYFLRNIGGSEQMMNLTAQNDLLETKLSDGSEIALNKNSILTYPENFEGGERRVALKGEAFFDIERNETKPFIIDLPNKFEVKVLGTSFNIKANEKDSKTEIFVVSGSVEVSSGSDKIVLAKNEKATIDNESGRITKEENSSTTSELFWKEKSLKFDGETIDEVVDLLMTTYKEEIKIECIDSEQRIRSIHKNEDLEDVLNVLAETQEVKYYNEVRAGKRIHFLTCKDD